LKNNNLFEVFEKLILTEVIVGLIFLFSGRLLFW
jgi:hypothetical protein